jgi:hypothetical protein
MASEPMGPQGRGTPLDRRSFLTGASILGTGFDCGHFLTEEKPDETAAALVALLRR